MANLRQAFEYASQNPDSDFAKNLEQLAASGSLDGEAKKYGIDLTPFKPQSTLDQAKDVAVGFGKGLARTAVDTVSGLQTIGQGAMMAAGIPNEVVAQTGFKSLDTSTPEGEALQAKLQPTNEMQKYGGYGETGAELLLGGGAGLIKDVAVGGTKLAKTGVANLAERVIPSIKEGVKPTPKLEQAIGQVLQGKTTNIKPFEQAISTIDTTGVKTYSDLANKFDEAIPSLSAKVDAELAKDTNMYKLSDLAVKATSKGGQEVSTDYVTKALSGLKELYTTIGDDVAKQNIDEIIAQANTNGLTRKEVNDISRIYNQEFGTKAFSKATGDALTSVNAQAYENVRKGLKNVARAGIGGDEAKVADQIMSSIYDSKKLIERNVEAVNKLKQRIEERGWIQKATYGAIKAVDTLTGGVIRGATDAVLNRGTGLKTLNALDLESNLKRNLEVIKKALNANTEQEAQKILETVGKVDTSKATKIINNNTAYGGLAGLEIDEKGNATFDPVKAGIGMAGMSIGTNKIGQIKLNNIAKRMDAEDVKIIENFQDGFATKKLTEANKEAMNNLLETMKIYGIGKNGDMATIGQVLLDLKRTIK